MATVAKTMNMPMARSDCERSVRTRAQVAARGVPAHAREVGGRDRDGDDAVRQHEDAATRSASTAFEAPVPMPSDATRLWTRPASWVTSIMPKVQPAALPVAPEADAAPAEVGTERSPARRQKQKQEARLRQRRRGVAVPASTAIRPGVQTSTTDVLGRAAEEHDEDDEARDRDDVVDHGRPGERPEDLRAFSTSPSSEYIA